MSTNIRLATIDDLEQLVPLFDAYRQFYGQVSDTSLARDFLAARIQQQESLILAAVTSAGVLIGFTQLFPSFSSVRAGRTFVLNDLFVAPEARRSGVARALLNEAATLARSRGAIRLSLSTARTNTQAQGLYESLAWQRDEKFLYYTLAL